MAPHNTGSKKLKARRNRLRKRYEEQIASILPDLLAIHSSTPESVAVRERTEMDNGFVDWEGLHPELNPSTTQNGSLPEVRAARKRMQIGSMLSWTIPLLPDGGVAVDFCAGSGHLGLVLAAIRPDATVYIVEKKRKHCEIAEERDNVKVVNCELSDFKVPFSVGLGLHACGPATDMIHSSCLAAGAAYVLAPCCYGFIAKALDKYKLDFLDHNSNGGMVMVDIDDLPPLAPPPTRSSQGGDSEQAADRSAAGSEDGARHSAVEAESAQPLGNGRGDGDGGGAAGGGGKAAKGVEDGGGVSEGLAALGLTQKIAKSFGAGGEESEGGGREASQEAEIERAMYLEAMAVRERARAAKAGREARELGAPLQASVALLDSLLDEVYAASHAEVRALLDADRLRLRELKRTFWGWGVAFPRSVAFKAAVDLETYSCIAGAADGTFWASESSYTPEKEQAARRSMLAINSDRSQAAAEVGYVASVVDMCEGDTAAAGQKNQLVIGRPLPSVAKLGLGPQAADAAAARAPQSAASAIMIAV